MITDDQFNYEEFAQKLVDQIPSLIPQDISEKHVKYIIDTAHNFIILAGESLVNDDTIKLTSEDAAYICQILAEWTFHKSVDLARSDIPNEYWDTILQKIAFTIFEITKHCYKNKIKHEELLDTVERHVIKTYNAAIDELLEENKIKKKTAKNAKKQSNIDKMAEERKEEEEEEEEEDSDYVETDTSQKPKRNFKYIFCFLCVITLIKLAVKCPEVLNNIVPLKITIIIALIALVLFIILERFCSIINPHIEQANNKMLQNLVAPEKMYDRMGIDELSIQFASNLVQIADQEFLAKLVELRQTLTDELGYIIPKIRLQDNPSLYENEYQLFVRNNLVACGYIYPEKYMVTADKLEEHYQCNTSLDYIIGISPINKATVYWLSQQEAEKLPENTLAIEATDVIINHLRNYVIKNVNEIFSVNDVVNYLNLAKSSYNDDFIDNYILNKISIFDIKTILTRLIREEVSIKDYKFILESLAKNVQHTQDPIILTEKLRKDLKYTITSTLYDEYYRICGVEISPEITQILKENSELSEEQSQYLIETIANVYMEQKPVIFADEKIRYVLYELLVETFPEIKVVSKSEIAPNTLLEIKKMDTEE